jgi:hypothetical protein
MGLRSGGSSLAVAGSCGDGAVSGVPLDGGGGGGHTPDPVLDEFGLASLASILSAGVPVGQPRGSIQIRAVCLYAGRGDGELGTGMTLTGSSSLLVTVTTTLATPYASATPSSPSPIPSDENTGCLYATGYEHGPIPWMAQGISRWPHGELVRSEGSIGQ